MWLSDFSFLLVEGKTQVIKLTGFSNRSGHRQHTCTHTHTEEYTHVPTLKSQCKFPACHFYHWGAKGKLNIIFSRLQFLIAILLPFFLHRPKCRIHHRACTLPWSWAMTCYLSDFFGLVAKIFNGQEKPEPSKGNPLKRKSPETIYHIPI